MVFLDFRKKFIRMYTFLYILIHSYKILPGSPRKFRFFKIWGNASTQETQLEENKFCTIFAQSILEHPRPQSSVEKFRGDPHFVSDIFRVPFVFGCKVFESVRNEIIFELIPSLQMILGWNFLIKFVCVHFRLTYLQIGWESRTWVKDEYRSLLIWTGIINLIRKVII